MENVKSNLPCDTNREKAVEPKENLNFNNDSGPKPNSSFIPLSRSDQKAPTELVNSPLETTPTKGDAEYSADDSSVGSMEKMKPKNKMKILSRRKSVLKSSSKVDEVAPQSAAMSLFGAVDIPNFDQIQNVSINQPENVNPLRNPEPSTSERFINPLAKKPIPFSAAESLANMPGVFDSPRSNSVGLPTSPPPPPPPPPPRSPPVQNIASTQKPVGNSMMKKKFSKSSASKPSEETKHIETLNTSSSKNGLGNDTVPVIVGLNTIMELKRQGFATIKPSNADHSEESKSKSSLTVSISSDRKLNVDQCSFTPGKSKKLIYYTDSPLPPPQSSSPQASPSLFQPAVFAIVGFFIKIKCT